VFLHSRSPATSTRKPLGHARWQGRSAALAFVLGLACAGCQSFKSVSQCNKLLETVNTDLDQARELHAKPPTVENYRSISDVFGHLEAQIAEQTKVDGEFERTAKGYAKQMRRVSREARNFAQALERLEKAKQAADAEQEKQADEELKRIRERAARLVDASVTDAKKFREACRPKG
jgi:hypothetical protein